MAIDPLTAAGFAAVSGAFNIFGAGEARGAAQRAGRTANQERVKAGKKAVRAAFKNLEKNYEISKETIEILERNTYKQIELMEAENLRDWEASEDLRFDDYKRDTAAFNQSVTDYYTNINFNDISANMAYTSEKNYMDEFRQDQKYAARAAGLDVQDFYTRQNFERKSDAIDRQFGRESDILDREASTIKLKGQELDLKQAGLTLRGEKLKHRQTLTSDITSRLSLRHQQEALRAKSAFEEDQDIIKGMQTIGNIKATGMAGRSARKAVQAASFDVGARQAMRADALSNANSVFLNEMAKLDNQKYYSAQTYDIGKHRYGIAQDTYSLAEESHKLTGRRIDLKGREREYKLDLKRDMRDHAGEMKLKSWDLETEKRADQLKSALKASTLRQHEIAAGKYSADLQAHRGLLPEPELRKQTPIPFEAFRPEFQQPVKPNKQDFYDQHMPHLSDENKIYGDRGAGAPVSPWIQAGSFATDVVGAYVGAGGDFNASTLHGQ